MTSPEQVRSAARATKASGWAAAVLVLLALLVPQAAWSAAPINDDRSDAVLLQPGYAGTVNSEDASVEANEGLSPNDPSGRYCSNTEGVNTLRGVQLDHSVWWEFVGDGGPMTVSSDESADIDTVMAVYEKSGGPPIGCNDDLQPFDPSRPSLAGARATSEMVIPSVAGRHYLVQLGGCTAPTPPLKCYHPTFGDLTLRVSPTPPNDDRANATPIVAGGAALTTNTGATLEAGEPANCLNSLYAKTIWFRYSVPAIGTASFSVAGAQSTLNTVLAVYRGDASTPLACNDDALAGTPGGSSIPSIQPAGAAVDVEPGDYFIQIGGYYDVGLSTVAARHGPLNVQVQFSEDTDIDNDGYQSDVDCNDHDPTIHPGATEIPNNDVDENCDSIVAYDRDLDGWLAKPAGPDCDDSNASIHPDAIDVPGNGIDENCDGSDARQPVLNIIFRLDQQPSPTTTRIYSLIATNVPAKTTFTLKCVGRACRATTQRLVVRQRHVSVALTTKLRGTLRRPLAMPLTLPAGTVLELRATKPGFIGRFRSYRILRGKAPAVQDLCLGPRGKRAC